MDNIHIQNKYESKQEKDNKFILYANFVDKNENVIEDATHIATTFGELCKNDLTYLESIPLDVKEKAFQTNMNESITHLKCAYGDGSYKSYAM